MPTPGRSSRQRKWVRWLGIVDEGPETSGFCARRDGALNICVALHLTSWLTTLEKRGEKSVQPIPEHFDRSANESRSSQRDQQPASSTHTQGANHRARQNQTGSRKGLDHVMKSS